MKTDDEIISRARAVLKTEADAVLGLVPQLDERFAAAVRLIETSEGRVVLTGIGKSAIIAQKITATLNSTGTPAIFMHAADAIHGDLGIIQQNDVVVCISNSGNTAEIKVLVPLLKQGGNKLVAMAGNPESYLARHADIVLHCSIDREACSNNLAPTSSTTAQLAMGDALAVCLLDRKGFRPEDFARFHPGGALGKRLYLRVGELAAQNARPLVRPDDPVREVIIEISGKRLGATVVAEGNNIAGVITDGDLRRMLERNQPFEQLKAADIMSSNPRTIDAEALAVDALKVFQEFNITQLIVTSGGKYAGFIHFHDLLREGII